MPSAVEHIAKTRELTFNTFYFYQNFQACSFIKLPTPFIFMMQQKICDKINTFFPQLHFDDGEYFIKFNRTYETKYSASLKAFERAQKSAKNFAEKCKRSEKQKKRTEIQQAKQ